MNVPFLQSADYLAFISESAFRKLCRDSENKVFEVESYAEGYIYEKLSARYDIEQEINRSGEDRNPALVRWMIILAVYYLYQSVPDDENTGARPDQLRGCDQGNRPGSLRTR